MYQSVHLKILISKALNPKSDCKDYECFGRTHRSLSVFDAPQTLQMRLCERAARSRSPPRERACLVRDNSLSSLLRLPKHKQG